MAHDVIGKQAPNHDAPCQHSTPTPFHPNSFSTHTPAIGAAVDAGLERVRGTLVGVLQRGAQQQNRPAPDVQRNLMNGRGRSDVRPARGRLSHPKVGPQRTGTLKRGKVDMPRHCVGRVNRADQEARPEHELIGDAGHSRVVRKVKVEHALQRGEGAHCCLPVCAVNVWQHTVAEVVNVHKDLLHRG